MLNKQTAKVLTLVLTNDPHVTVFHVVNYFDVNHCQNFCQSPVKFSYIYTCLILLQLVKNPLSHLATLSRTLILFVHTLKKSSPMLRNFLLRQSVKSTRIMQMLSKPNSFFFSNFAELKLHNWQKNATNQRPMSNRY